MPTLLLAFLLLHTTGHTCTTFVLQADGRLYFGRNLDWDWEDACVLINPAKV